MSHEPRGGDVEQERQRLANVTVSSHHTSIHASATHQPENHCTVKSVHREAKKKRHHAFLSRDSPQASHSPNGAFRALCSSSGWKLAQYFMDKNKCVCSERGWALILQLSEMPLAPLISLQVSFFTLAVLDSSHVLFFASLSLPFATDRHFLAAIRITRLPLDAFNNRVPDLCAVQLRH